MRVGAFEIDDSIHGLRNPQAIATLRPWVDAGNVATLALAALRERLGARDAGALARPGEFFDFTRYRPMVRYDGDDRRLTVPNTRVSVARREGAPDLVFIDMLEPHMRAEDYIDSIGELLAFLGVKAFCRIGAWYAGAPHSRPLRVSHSVGGVQVDPKTGQPVRPGGRYEGPTSMMNVLSDALEERGIENRTLMLQLPHYAQMDDDYSGAAAMLESLGDVYGLSAKLTERIISYRTRGEQQYSQLDLLVGRDLELRGLLAQLEAVYDAQYAAAGEDTPGLSAEIERFLDEITGSMDSRDDG